MRVTRGSTKLARLEASAELVPGVATAILASGACSGRELMALRAVSRRLRDRVSPVDALREALKHGDFGDATKIARLIPSTELVAAVSAYRPAGNDGAARAATMCNLRDLSLDIISRADVTHLPSSLAYTVCMSLILSSQFKVIWEHQNKLSFVDPSSLMMATFDILSTMRRPAPYRHRFLVSQYDVAALVLLHLVIKSGWVFPETEVMESNCKSFMTVVLMTRCSQLWRLAVRVMGPWEDMYLKRLKARITNEHSRMDVLDLINVALF